jgi:hypothetical protein
MKLIAVSAGLSTPSSTRLLADRLTDAVGKELADQGHEAEVDVIEMRALAVAIADNLVTGFPPPQLATAPNLRYRRRPGKAHSNTTGGSSARWPSPRSSP